VDPMRCGDAVGVPMVVDGRGAGIVHHRCLKDESAETAKDLENWHRGRGTRTHRTPRDAT
jgi:hypothetical protein